MSDWLTQFKPIEALGWSVREGQRKLGDSIITTLDQKGPLVGLKIKEGQTLDTCSIDTCLNPPLARGWCNKHYQRWYKHGDPLTVLSPSQVRVSKPKNCAVEGCGPASTLTRGYCSGHHYRLQKYGDPLATPLRLPVITDPVERFWTRVDKSAGADGCWIWTGPVERRRPSASPYGIFAVDGKQIRAHRYIYQVVNKVILNSGQPIHHTCSNTICQNPKHLQVTTQRDNTAEMLERRFYVNRIKELEQELESLKQSCSCIR